MGSVNPGNVTGSFQFDFTTNSLYSADIHFGSVIANGNPNSSPVHVTTTSLTASAESDTLGYGLQFTLAYAITPTSGAPILLDPPGTSPQNANNFWTVDSNGVSSTLTLTGGSVEPAGIVPEPSTFVLLASGTLGLMFWRRARLGPG